MRLQDLLHYKKFRENFAKEFPTQQIPASLCWSGAAHEEITALKDSDPLQYEARKDELREADFIFDECNYDDSMCLMHDPIEAEEGRIKYPDIHARCVKTIKEFHEKYPEYEG